MLPYYLTPEPHPEFDAWVNVLAKKLLTHKESLPKRSRAKKFVKKIASFVGQLVPSRRRGKKNPPRKSRLNAMIHATDEFIRIVEDMRYTESLKRDVLKCKLATAIEGTLKSQYVTERDIRDVIYKFTGWHPRPSKIVLEEKNK